MLCSAFSRESESVYVNLLTYNDLQMMKARKMGVSTSLSSSTSASPSQAKRYIILTYAGEFDRVNFPLALGFEETPNPATLQRIIKKLRQKVVEREGDLPHTARERYVRCMIFSTSLILLLGSSDKSIQIYGKRILN